MLKVYMLSTCTIILLLATSCGTDNKEKINSLMDKRSRAFSLRDSEMYAECIHENYRVTNKDGKTLGKQDVVNIFKKSMAIIDSISFGETRRYIYVSDHKANVIAVSLIEVRVGDYSVVYEAKEVFGLTNTLMGWRITSESGFDLLSGMKILNG